MKHYLKEQIAANAEYLNDYVTALLSAQYVLEEAPLNRLLRIHITMLETSIQIMIENIDMLQVQLKSIN